MPPIDQTKDPILRKLADTIRASTNVFKRIYYGRPEKIGSSSYPSLILVREGESAGTFTNVEDYSRIRVSITVVNDERDTISDDKEMVKGVNALIALMEARNDDYTLKPDSVLGIIRHNVELDIANCLRIDLDTMSSVYYGKPKMRAPWSLEAVLMINLYFVQLR